MNVGGYLMIDLEGAVFGQTSGLITDQKLVDKIMDRLVANAGKKATYLTNFTVASQQMPATPVAFSLRADGDSAQGMLLYNLSNYFLYVRMSRTTGNLRYSYIQYTEKT